MSLKQLLNRATDKSQFEKINEYIDFCREYLIFAQDGLQAEIVSQNEPNCRFYQYKKDGGFNTTRPINSDIMIPLETFDNMVGAFHYALSHIREINKPEDRTCINRVVYTCQQTIGATLDALPAKRSNTARKINGDLFERFIKLIITEIGIPVRSDTVIIPVVVDDITGDGMKFQCDIVIENDNELLAIGSVKTSSKDRLSKIFSDKYLYNKLTGGNVPYFAVFLNDVQRKGKEPKYGVDSTFLSGHFKVYTIMLNALDGVYYCDLRPNMETDEILGKYIRTLDCLLIDDIWKLFSD